ncbi:UvrD-helicase domain-containing protein [Levilactobacillus lanxiensis]|uniref:UvrD-helicase domain-containing protein n=1 Tax=Levilactobacillus lanxiensis TaxID=2799568 RepID=A0ABW4D2Y7_9LACO|nr:ATP-dependent helicase [Levilactobacillus lanxiensis]
MNNEKLAQKIISENLDDPTQLSVIQAQEKNVIVEAPAGYGKTYTMVSMIQYWMAKDYIKNYKKVLCLSFSVSAARRMKESVGLAFEGKSPELADKVFATNFHGLCRGILRKYGYLVGLRDIDKYTNLGTTQATAYKSLDSESLAIVNTFESGISNANVSEKMLDSMIFNYNKVIRNGFLCRSELPYNSIITFVLELFYKFNDVLSFYRDYFVAICVDEFQDTNMLGLSLIHKLVGKENKFIAFGDSMQEVYGFLGAMPDLISQETLNTESKYVRLKINHRFHTNRLMRTLDANFRSFRENPQSQYSLPVTGIQALHGTTIPEEADKISSLINRMLERNSDNRIAVLVYQKGRNTDALINKLSFNLDEQNIKLFDATFDENSSIVVDFQERVALMYQEKFASRPIMKLEIDEFIDEISHELSNTRYLDSLVNLLRAFLSGAAMKVRSRHRSEFIIDTLLSNSLRQSIGDVKLPVTVSKIHGSKGLEWDYVIIANFEQGEFPNYYDSRAIGFQQGENQLIVTKDNIAAVREFVNKFYVGFTRAKHGVFVAFSDTRYAGSQLQRTQVCCLATLHFIELRELS